MPHPRSNKVWSVPLARLRKAVKENTTFADVFRSIGFQPPFTHSYAAVKKRLDEEGISYSHIPKRTDKHGRQPPSTKPLKAVLVKGSNYCRKNLKHRLIEKGKLKNKCSICGLEGEWQGKPLVMILDHINGINNDNRLKNLRMVCPNCGSQLSTFSGRNCKAH